MPVLRTVVLVAAFALIAIGAFLIFTAKSSGSAPEELPKPLQGEPAWTHVCLGSMNDPNWCEDIGK
ncbi:hypothetical protein [Streptomyces sp. NPDC088360]|uniref:hypothetical protein n=1 Tax=Streptomyces sp. NPDC088360 TaxID=3154515 RepID=UPI00344D71FA